MLYLLHYDIKVFETMKERKANTIIITLSWDLWLIRGTDSASGDPEVVSAVVS